MDALLCVSLNIIDIVFLCPYAVNHEIGFVELYCLTCEVGGVATVQLRVVLG